MKDQYPTGLLVAHDPGQGAFLFIPGGKPQFIAFDQALKWKSRFSLTPVMLFAKAAEHNVGHFLPFPSLSCTGKPSDLGLEVSCALSDMCGQGVHNTAVVLDDVLDNPAWTGVN